MIATVAEILFYPLIIFSIMISDFDDSVKKLEQENQRQKQEIIQNIDEFSEKE